MVILKKGGGNTTITHPTAAKARNSHEEEDMISLGSTFTTVADSFHACSSPLKSHPPSSGVGDYQNYNCYTNNSYTNNSYTNNSYSNDSNDNNDSHNDSHAIDDYYDQNHRSAISSTPCDWNGSTKPMTSTTTTTTTTVAAAANKATIIMATPTNAIRATTTTTATTTTSPSTTATMATSPPVAAIPNATSTTLDSPKAATTATTDYDGHSFHTILHEDTSTTFPTPVHHDSDLAAEEDDEPTGSTQSRQSTPTATTPSPGPMAASSSCWMEPIHCNGTTRIGVEEVEEIQQLAHSSSSVSPPGPGGSSSSSSRRGGKKKRVRFCDPNDYSVYTIPSCRRAWTTTEPELAPAAALLWYSVDDFDVFKAQSRLLAKETRLRGPRVTHAIDQAYGQAQALAHTVVTAASASVARHCRCPSRRCRRHRRSIRPSCRSLYSDDSDTDSDTVDDEEENESPSLKEDDDNDDDEDAIERALYQHVLLPTFPPNNNNHNNSSRQASDTCPSTTFPPPPPQEDDDDEPALFPAPAVLEPLCLWAKRKATCRGLEHLTSKHHYTTRVETKAELRHVVIQMSSSVSSSASSLSGRSYLPTNDEDDATSSTIATNRGEGDAHEDNQWDMAATAAAAASSETRISSCQEIAVQAQHLSRASRILARWLGLADAQFRIAHSKLESLTHQIMADYYHRRRQEQEHNKSREEEEQDQEQHQEQQGHQCCKTAQISTTAALSSSTAQDLASRSSEQLQQHREQVRAMLTETPTLQEDDDKESGVEGNCTEDALETSESNHKCEDGNNLQSSSLSSPQSPSRGMVSTIPGTRTMSLPATHNSAECTCATATAKLHGTPYTLSPFSRTGRGLLSRTGTLLPLSFPIRSPLNSAAGKVGMAPSSPQPQSPSSLSLSQDRPSPGPRTMMRSPRMGTPTSPSVLPVSPRRRLPQRQPFHLHRVPQLPRSLCNVRAAGEA